MPAIRETSMLRCRFAPERYHDGLFSAYGLPFPQQLHNAVGKRKAEYLAGRHLAKLMLDTHGVSAVVPTGPHREPIWPDGWTGSITHTADTAMCCVARKNAMTLLGIDLEAWMNDQLANEIAGTIICEQERQVLAGSLHFSEALTLAFSAKESFFKAVFSIVGKYFDFDSVRIVGIDCAAQRFWLQVAEPLAPSLPRGHKVAGSFLREAGTIFTMVEATLA